MATICHGLPTVAVWPGGQGGGQAIASPAALKTGAPKCGEGAKMTAEVCMVSQSKVSLDCAA